MAKSLYLVLTLALASAGTAAGANSPAPPATPRSEARMPSMEEQFRDPPSEARPRVWWHWMNGNVSKEGIAKDLAWMKRIGIGGVQSFDVNLQTPQVVDERLIYMTPKWKEAFRFAATEAERLGLELAIASSPGFSITGGPWVAPEDGLKKLVWSETRVTGGAPISHPLPQPPSVTGRYQSIDARSDLVAAMSGAEQSGPRHYADVAVLAFPDSPTAMAQVASVFDHDGREVDPTHLADADFSSTVDLAPSESSEWRTLTYRYDEPQTVSSASLFLPRAWLQFFGSFVEARLEFAFEGEDESQGETWAVVAAMPVESVPTTISFDPVTARQFRLAVRFKGIDPDVLDVPAEGVALTNPLAMVAGMGARPIGVGDFRLFSTPLIDRFEAKAGYSLVADYNSISGPLPDDTGVAPADMIDLTGKMGADGTLDWTPPAGRWRILRLGYSLLGTTNHPAPPEATGLEVDKFDADAVRRYMEEYLGMYADVLGEDLAVQNALDAVLTDSIEVGAANWTPKMIEQFARLRGYDPTPWLPALTGTIVGSRKQSDRFLYDYRRTLADLIASEHYGTIATVAHEHGLLVYGEALESGRPSLGDDMAMRSHADIPMAAMWTRSDADGHKPTYIADIKGAASVAHIYGRTIVAAESLTSAYAPWAYAPADLKSTIDLEFALGVNRPVIHTSVHQPVDDKVPGISMGQFGQYFTRHESWAEMAGPWIDYIARNSLMLQQGRNVADVAYFYGEEAPLTGLYGDMRVADAPTDHAYDFINANALLNLLSNDGEYLVTPGGARYRVLYLGGSSRHMTLPTLRKLARLANDGATIVGLKPVGNPGLAGSQSEYDALVARLWPQKGDGRVGKGRVIASSDIDSALRGIGLAPDFRVSGIEGGGDILFVHRKLSDGDSYFLTNRSGRAQTVEAHFRVTGKGAEIWRAETGEVESVDYVIGKQETIVPLIFGPDESFHVVFRKPAASSERREVTARPTTVAQIEGPWDVQLQPARGEALAANMDRLAPLELNDDPDIRYFSGVATYRASFMAPDGWQQGDPLWLNLGAVGDLAEVTVNARNAGHAWYAPFRVDIGDEARPGQNQVEIKVANLWVNRLIGDAQPGAEKVSWTSNPTYRADAPLRPSGLIGPVTLEVGK